MMKKVLALISVFLICFMCFNVFADEDTVSAYYDSEKGVLILSGGAAGECTVTVTKGSTDFEAWESDLLNCIYFGVTESINGSRIYIPSGTAGGKYFVYIEGEDFSASCGFMIPGEISDDTLKIINSEKDYKKIKEAVEKEAESIGIDVSDTAYEMYNEYAYKIIAAISETYKTSADFVRDFSAALGIAEIANGDNTEKALRKNANTLNMSIEDDYDKAPLTEEAKSKLLGLLKDNNWITDLKNSNNLTSDFRSIYNSLAALASVKTADTRVALQDIITKDSYSLFGFVNENKDYKRLKNPDKVFGYMLKSKITTFEDIEKAFNESVQKCLDEQENGKGSGGGGGTSGGGTSGSSMGAFQVTPETQTKPEPQTNPEKIMFSDVPGDYWGYNAIMLMTEKGIVKGYDDGTFKPENKITRAEFTKLVIEALATENGENKDPVVFDDVKEQDWFYAVVSKAASLGIVKGRGSSFAPAEHITRQDAAVIIYRTCLIGGKSFKEGGKQFSDEGSIDDYAKEAISVLGANGFINGMPDGSFEPMQSLTRAQAVQMINNIIS